MKQNDVLWRCGASSAWLCSYMMSEHVLCVCACACAHSGSSNVWNAIWAKELVILACMEQLGYTCCLTSIHCYKLMTHYIPSYIPVYSYWAQYKPQKLYRNEASVPVNFNFLCWMTGKAITGYRKWDFRPLAMVELVHLVSWRKIQWLLPLCHLLKSTPMHALTAAGNYCSHIVPALSVLLTSCSNHS